MCHQVQCMRCAKPTWSGCGNHVERALAGVRLSERCTCEQSESDASAQSRPAASFADWGSAT